MVWVPVDSKDEVPDRLQGLNTPASRSRSQAETLLGFLQQRREKRIDCRSLLFTLCYSALFFALVLCHFSQRTVLRLTDAVAQDLPLAQLETDYPVALMAWLGNRAEAPRIGRSNNLVGGIRVVRQAPDVAVPGVLCERNPLEILGGKEPAVCGAGLNSNTSQWLLWPLQRQDVSTVYEAMQDWWPSGEAQGDSDHTEVTMLAHNPKLNYYVFYNLGVRARSAGLAELERSSTAFDAAPLWLDASADWDKGAAEKCIMVFDVLFVAMYAALAVLLVGRSLLSICRARCRCSKCGLPGFRMLLDAVIVIASVLLTTTYFYCLELTRGLLQLAGQLPAPSVGRTYSKEQLAQTVLQPASLDMAKYLQRLDAVLEQATQLQQGQAAVPWLVAILACCLCLRPFRAFRWSPRFLVLQKTVAMAFSDLVHSSFVVAMLLFGFALVGYTTFGTRFGLFSTIGDSLNSTFLFVWGFALDRHRAHLFEGSGGAVTALAVLWAVALNVVIALMLLKVFIAALVDAHLALMGEPGLAEPPPFFPKLKNDRAAPTASAGAVGSAQAAPLAPAGPAGTAQATANTPASAGAAQPSPRKRGCGSLLSGSIDDHIFRSLETNGTEMPVANTPAERARLEELMVLAAKSADSAIRHPSLHNTAQFCAHTEGSLSQLELLSAELVVRSHGLVDERASLLALNGAASAARAEETHVDSVPIYAALPRVQTPQDAADLAAASIVEDAKASDVSVTSSAKAAALVALQMDSPEPEPPGSTASGPTPAPNPQLELMRQQAMQQQTQQQQLYNLMEDRLSQASAAQEKRFERLEESIVRLGKRLEPMLQEGGSHDVKVDPSRIEHLEEKVRKLMKTLAPIMDLERPFERPLATHREPEQRGREQRRSRSASRHTSRQASRASSRPPSPPRASSVAPAASKVPRARSATPAMWSSRAATPAVSERNL